MVSLLAFLKFIEVVIKFETEPFDRRLLSFAVGPRIPPSINRKGQQDADNNRATFCKDSWPGNFLNLSHRQENRWIAAWASVATLETNSSLLAVSAPLANDLRQG